VHDATKRFEVETLLKAGLPAARVAELAWISLWTVHGVLAGSEARCAETEGTDTRAGPTEARPPASGLGRPSKTADYRELVASTLDAQPGLETLEVLRRARSAAYGGGKTALYSLVRELRPRAVRPICRFEDVVREFTSAVSQRMVDRTRGEIGPLNASRSQVRDNSTVPTRPRLGTPRYWSF
jgi:hypothetical protein